MPLLHENRFYTRLPPSPANQVHDVSYSPLPSPPPKGIFRYVVRDEIDTFLKPLYARQWSIRGHSKKTTFDGLFLGKTFKFSGYDATMNFLNEVAQIVRKENHHPEITFDYNSVKFATQTHHVARLKVREFDGKICRSPKPPPGITPSDVRLAIFVENLFTEVYLVDGKGRAAIQPDPGEMPGTLEEFRNLGQINLNDSI